MSAYAVAIVGGLLGMIGWGGADFCAKISVDAIHELSTLVWGHLMATALLIAAGVWIWMTTTHPDLGGITVIAALAGLGVLQGVIYMLLYRGFGQGDVAPLSTVFASFSGIVALASVAFLGESTSGARSAILVSLFVGVVLLSASNGRPLIRGLGTLPGFRFVAAATVLAAGWTLGWSQVVHGRSAIPCAAAMYAPMTLFILAVALGKKVDLGVPRAARLPLFGIAAGEAIAYAGITWGYSAAVHVSVVAMLSGAFSLPTIALARVFLGERLGRRAAVAAGIVVASGALLTVL